MEQPAGRRRRIDRVADPDLLADVADSSPADLRALRDQCREEEERLSYARRVLQGQIDIVRGEASRRTGGEGTSSLLADLPRILADEPSSSTRQARTVTFYSPEDEGGRRTGDTVLDMPSLGRIPDLSDEEITELLVRLQAEETAVSELRRQVMANLDALQEELVRRYRDGGVTIDEVMASTRTQPPKGTTG